MFKKKSWKNYVIFIFAPWVIFCKHSWLYIVLSRTLLPCLQSLHHLISVSKLFLLHAASTEETFACFFLFYSKEYSVVNFLGLILRINFPIIWYINFCRQYYAFCSIQAQSFCMLPTGKTVNLYPDILLIIFIWMLSLVSLK